MKKKTFILIIVILLISLLLLIGFRLKERNENKVNLKKSKIQNFSVTVIYPRKRSFSTSITVSGIIVPKKEVQITPKANGKLTSLNVDEGFKVKSGQSIGLIDHSELDAQIEQANAQVRLAKANLNLSMNGPLKSQIDQAKSVVKQAESTLKQLQANKNNLEKDYFNYQILEKKGIITRQQLDSTKTQLEVMNQQIASAKQQVISSGEALKILTDGTRPELIDVSKAQLDNALAMVKLYESQLKNYNILSPINGIVTKKFLDAGSLVTQNTPVITVSSDSDSEIIMNVPESEIENIKIGQKVEIRTSGSSEKFYKALVEQIYPNIDSQTRNGKVKAKLTEKTNLKLGMNLICNIYTVEKANALILPTDAVITDNGQSYVYTVVKDKAERKYITLGIQEPEETEVISGITTDDRVIQKGNTFVNQGSHVEIQSKDIK